MRVAVAGAVRGDEVEVALRVVAVRGVVRVVFAAVVEVPLAAAGLSAAFVVFTVFATAVPVACVAAFVAVATAVVVALTAAATGLTTAATGFETVAGTGSGAVT